MRQIIIQEPLTPERKPMRQQISFFFTFHMFIELNCKSIVIFHNLLFPHV